MKPSGPRIASRCNKRPLFSSLGFLGLNLELKNQVDYFSLLHKEIMTWGVFINNYGQSHNCRGKCNWSIFYHIKTEKEKLFGLENCMHREQTYKIPIEQIKYLIAKKSWRGWSKCSHRMENQIHSFPNYLIYDSIYQHIFQSNNKR